MRKRLISLLLVLSMFCSILPVPALAGETQKNAADNTAAQNPFQDVAEDAWYHDDVVYVYTNSLFLGVSDTVFAPERGMSRGMFVTVLGRMAGINPDNYRGGSSFSDVEEDAYYAPYVAWATKYGITSGMGNGRFQPDFLVTRQQMAVFFVNYFESFDVDYGAEKAGPDGSPGDIDAVAGWAKDAVLKLWRVNLLSGDGVNFDPESTATRAQTAAICHRADETVDTWYSEPGVVSERGKTEPEKKTPLYISDYYSVTFYDGKRKIDTLYVKKNEPLKQVPAVEKSSKEGAILLGYYTNPEFTTPFYAEEPVTRSMRVYAKYQAMDSTETLNFTTFTQLDQGPDLSFCIRRVSGSVTPENAAVLTVKDGSAPVKLSITAANRQAISQTAPAGESGLESGSDMPETAVTQAEAPNPDPVCIVSAQGGFNEGCSYELTLAEGWVFDEKPETIRTASFSIFKPEVDNMRMSRDVKYLLDTDTINYTVNGSVYPVLTSDLVTENGGSFTYDGNPSLSEGDLLCVYVGTHPDRRTTKSGAELLDPAVYVKVSGISGGKVSFEPLNEDDRTKLYDVPDNFPLLVNALPASAAGSANIDDLDISMYENMMGKDDGNLAYARSHIGVGDFVTLYTGTISGENDLYFGEITQYNEAAGTITYKQTTKQAILDSMELYSKIDLAGSDLVTPEQQQAIVADVQADLDRSDFGEQAAYLLADLVTSTNAFQEDASLQGLLAPSGGAERNMPRGGLSLDTDGVKVTARLVTSGSQLHFGGGVQLALDVKAKFNAPIGNSLSNTLSIDLAATFVQEVAVQPTIKGSLVTKEILFIPIPIGVEVGASIDVKNYTALSFDAEISTHDNSGVLYSTSIASDLMDMMSASDSTGLSREYQNSLDALMAKYSEMLFQETDWITLVEEDMFQVECGIYAIGIGLRGDFVVSTDMSIAIGSNLEYEVGKRYNFWFKIGLFKPTAGSSSMDLIDESFAFQFYVMGKLGIRAGVKLTLYVQVGCGKLASVGISTQLGPYIKLYGFFIYEVTKYRPKNTNNWTYHDQMAGALFLEFGLYFTLSFEASALSLFEYSHDFVDEEIPLLTAGDARYFYGFSYSPEEDESVIIRDDDRNIENGISMKLPDSVRELSYMTLNTGARGKQALPLDRYHYTVSNPNFSLDTGTGTVCVSVPEKTHFMECDLTITYLHGKMAFSTYDMSVTVPLVWTDLSDRELREYFTASVRVGNDADGYETVWSKKVLRGQSFDLPADEDIKSLINYNSTKYSGAAGYQAGRQMEELTIITDTVYDYKVDYRTYGLTVNGIQNADGTTRSETFTARYGQTFDFSRLKNSGTEKPGETYTRFTDVTAPGLDLSRPINGAMAEKLNNSVPATANYVDNSVTAVFTFSGITHGDVTVKTRKNTTPGTAEIGAVVDAAGDVGIEEISPALGNIDQSTNYIVNCVRLSGARADIAFDMNGAADIEVPAVLDKLVGSLIVNLPEVTRTGYTFDGWFTAPVGGERAETQTVPADGIVLYAHWVPNEYTVNFRINGGVGTDPECRTVTYDTLYGELPAPAPKSGMRFVGWWTSIDDSGTEIDSRTVVKITEEQTLYAHWKPLVQIDPKWLDFGEQETFIYSKGAVRGAEYMFNASDPAVVGEDGIPFPTNGFTLTYVPTQGGLGLTTEEPVNAGTYKVRVTRPADVLYAAFEAEYPGVLKIEKADRDVSTTGIDSDSTLHGFNYLSVATTVDDLGPGAEVAFTMKIGGTEGISTNDGRCFFCDLSENSNYTVNLTYVSVTGDPNYNDARGSMNVSAAVYTTAAPDSVPNYMEDTGWYTEGYDFTLTTAAQMYGFAKLLRQGQTFAGKTVRLGADVDLSSYAWDTRGSGTGFCGTFDGQGYKIYGLYINTPAEKTVGMFRRIENGSRVQNVLLAGGYVRGSENVGAVVGYMENGSTVTNCTNFATVRAEGQDAGGIAGQVSTDQNDHGGRIMNCVNYGRISAGSYHTGGIVGYHLGNSRLENCANYGPVSGSDHCIGGIAGENYNRQSRVYNCVNAGSVTGSNGYRGAIVGRNNEDDGYVEQGYYLRDSAPGRKGTGTKSGAEDDDAKHVECSAFSSFAGNPDRVVEDGCSGKNLCDALNHWVERCGTEYSRWQWYNGVLVPGAAPKL